MNDKLRFASVLFANTQLQIELIDRLRGTALFRQSLKNMYNKTQKENEKLIDHFYKGMNPDAEMQLHKLVGIVEKFMEIVETKDIDTFSLFMDEFINDNIKVEEDEELC